MVTLEVTVTDRDTPTVIAAFTGGRTIVEERDIIAAAVDIIAEVTDVRSVTAEAMDAVNAA
jgi:hypothetical protein